MPTPPTASPSRSCDLGGEKWTAPYWQRVNTAGGVQEVPPLQFSALFILQPSWKKIQSLLTFSQSENCVHPIFLKCQAVLESSKLYHAMQSVYISVCAREQTEAFLGRSGRPIAKRRGMFNGLERITAQAYTLMSWKIRRKVNCLLQS